MTSHKAILLASGDIKRHISIGLFPLNIYHWVPGYPTNYPIGYPGNKLPYYGSLRYKQPAYTPLLRCSRVMVGQLVHSCSSFLNPNSDPAAQDSETSTCCNNVCMMLYNDKCCSSGYFTDGCLKDMLIEKHHISRMQCERDLLFRTHGAVVLPAQKLFLHPQTTWRISLQMATFASTLTWLHRRFHSTPLSVQTCLPRPGPDTHAPHTNLMARGFWSLRWPKLAFIT